MSNINIDNERLKRRYFSFLKDTKGKDVRTVDKVAAALAAFERSTRLKSFGKFRIEQAIAFKSFLERQQNHVTRKPLSKGTITAVLLDVRQFFIWLADQPGYRSKVRYSDAEYLNPSKEDRQKARAHRIAKGPTVEQLREVISKMPCESPLQKRDRALIAFTLLTGSRVGSTISLKLKHVNIAEGSVFMDAREVHTKNSKTFSAGFFPIGDDFRLIFEEWVDYLLHKEKFGPDDPLFPSTLIEQSQTYCFKAAGLSRQHWTTSAPVQRAFKDAFVAAGYSYCNPHSLRNTLTRLGYERCGGDLKALKVWSQNLGHESMLTTYLGYGAISPAEQAEIMKELWSGTRSLEASQSELTSLLRKAIDIHETAAFREQSVASALSSSLRDTITPEFHGSNESPP